MQLVITFYTKLGLVDRIEKIDMTEFSLVSAILDSRCLASSLFRQDIAFGAKLVKSVALDAHVNHELMIWSCVLKDFRGPRLGFIETYGIIEPSMLLPRIFHSPGGFHPVPK